MAALDDLIAIYKEAQLALIKIITGNTGAGTKTYYNTILRQLTALLNQLAAQTGRYISTEIPKEYKAALEQTYDYFKRNNLQMNLPEMFAQIHSDAVSELAAEMQHHITEGIFSAGRRVMRYADIARDNALRQNGLRASAVKIASAQTVRDMQKDLIRRLSEDGFFTVQYGSGKYAYQVGLDSYAAMVARSTTREAGNLAREKQLLANGYDLVVITEHKPCCELCARVQGRVFSISGKDKRFPPLSAAFTSGYRNVHPNCRCVAVPWIEEMRSPEERQAAIEKGSQPLRDERSDKEKALYTQQQSDRRQMRADLIQYERYKARLGDDAPQTFSAFRRIKNEDGDRWEGLQKEYRQRFESVHNSSIDNSGGSGIIKTENLKMSADTGFTLGEKQYEVKEDKKQVEDSYKYAKEVLGAGNVKFDKLKNNEVIQPMLDQVNNLKAKHKKSFSQIFVDDTMSDADFAMVSPDLSLHLNAKYMNSAEATADFLARMKKQKLLPKGFENTDYLITHEYMHYISRSEVDNPRAKVHKVIPDETKMLKNAPSKNSLISKNEYVADSMAMIEISSINDYSESKWNSWLKIYNYFFN